MDGHLGLPFCLDPIFIVVTPKYGASAIPLEEFPTMQVEIFKVERYKSCPSDAYKYEFSLFEAKI